MTSSEPVALPPEPPKSRALVVLLFTAFASSFVLFMSYVHIISALPRPMHGESVMIPWSVCLIGYLALPALLPWLVSFPFVRSRSLRLYFLACLFIGVLVWYRAFDFDSVLLTVCCSPRHTDVDYDNAA
jgi:hypothetical protein